MKLAAILKSPFYQFKVAAPARCGGGGACAGSFRARLPHCCGHWREPGPVCLGGTAVLAEGTGHLLRAAAGGGREVPRRVRGR